MIKLQTDINLLQSCHSGLWCTWRQSVQ